MKWLILRYSVIVKAKNRIAYQVSDIDGFDETNPYIKEIIATGERII